MYKIVHKARLNNDVTRMSIEAPYVARKAMPGQFIILRVDEDGERIPLTVAKADRENGLIDIIFQVVGSTTKKLDAKEEGEHLADFVGPLGKASDLDGLENVMIVAGGVGCAIALPVATRLKELGTNVTSIIGFRSKDILILEDEFAEASDELIVTTDDGSYGEHGMVTQPMERLLKENPGKFDRIITIGPLIMMKFVTLTAKPYGVPIVASMNPVMIDGTGMCGGCRLTVGGEMKFACVDGPEFDGYEIDFDEAISRSTFYGDHERHAYEETCNLLNKEVQSE